MPFRSRRDAHLAHSLSLTRLVFYLGHQCRPHLNPIAPLPFFPPLPCLPLLWAFPHAHPPTRAPIPQHRAQSEVRSTVLVTGAA